MSQAKIRGTTLLAAVLCAASAAIALAAEPAQLIAQSRKLTPVGPWPAGDERGMTNTLGAGTNARCAWHLGQTKAKTYEVSYVRSNTMPTSPFSGPYVQRFKPSSSIPGTAHLFNGEQYDAGAEPAAQATQIDALGHFAVLRQPWDGKGIPPADEGTYYGGFTQRDVKPNPESPLLRLGADKIPPIITTAVLLDAKTHVGGGAPMKPGALVTAADIEKMLKAQGLARRGILPGDVVYVRTGWGDFWKDPDTDKTYYSMAPGLSYDAARYLGERRVVAIGLDTPFIDPVPEGMLAGKAGPAAGTPAGLPFAVHHHMLTQMGIHHIENANLAQLANERVWTSCTMIMALRTQGAAGSAIRPIAIGVPDQR